MIRNDVNISNWVKYYRNLGEVILLESQKKDHPENKISYLAANPQRIIKVKNGKVYTKENELKKSFIGNSFEALKSFRQKNRNWLFGYFSYDLKNDTEHLTSDNKELIDAPDMFFMEPQTLIRFDGNNYPEFILGKSPSVLPDFDPDKGFKVQSVASISAEEYISKIKQAQREIVEGDYYEINLSHAREFSFEGDSFQLYQAMKEVGPVPFAAYCKIGNVEVCSSSPERFLKRTGKKVSSQPIKGTISAGDEFDLAEIERLLNTEKNRAENLMIVDLVRNDLNRVAKAGTVGVTKLFEIQHFSTVHQMVSTVECEVDENSDSVDIIKSCFPMGSMTGAPKISAMKAIDRLENYKRGIYSGAIGYFTPQDDFDFNVVIRTAIIRNEKLIYPVGGAITSDSFPEEEWEETLWKSRALEKVMIKSDLSE